MIHYQGDVGRHRAVIPVLLLLIAALVATLTAACQRDTKVEERSAPPPPLSISSDPRDGTEEVSASTPLRVSFTRPVDHDAVEHGFAIEPRAAGFITWEGDTLVFSPSPGWQLDARYRVALSIPSPDGKAGGKWETSFATVALPRVIRFAPALGEKSARTDSAVAFEFTRPVDEASFLQHLDVTPEIVGKVVRSGNIVSYVPIERLKTGLKYSVVLRAGVRDQRGLETTKETSFQFATMTSPRVVSVTPGTNSTDNNTAAQIAVEFDRPMNRESVENAFSVYPSLRGTTIWQGNKLVFKAGSLSPATRYTIRVKPGAVRDQDENYLLEPLQSDFVTAGQVAAVSGPKPSPTVISQLSSAALTPTPISVASAARGPAPVVPAPALAPPPPTVTSVPQPTSTPVPPATATPPPTATPAQLTAADLLTATEYELVASHNAQRRAAGLPPLTLDPRLVEIARYRSADMARRGYFSHTSPDGSTAFTIMDARGIRYSWAGENLALNDASGHQSVEIAMNGWMASVGHRANITNPRFDYVGVGMATNTKGVNYYTVVFLAGPR